ncbi:MAG: type II secretion system F family protein [Kiritimatiellia bacterium]|jgi:type II secretory pathway component PulF
MSVFAYTALSGGKRVQGRIEAPDRRTAMALLKRRGETPLSLREAAPSAVVASTPWWKFSAGDSMKMKPGEVLLFTSELSDLLAAGMTLGQALNCLAGHGQTPAARVAGDLRDRIIGGASLSDAVKAHPDSFPPLYGNMIHAGEASGAIPEVLRRLVEHYERMQAMKERITQALAYPVIVLVMGVLTVIFAMVKIVPQFLTVFENLGTTLPLPTRILLGMSDFTVKYGIFVAIGVVIVVVLLRRYVKTPAGRLRLDTFKLKLPLVKGIVANGIFTNMANTLQTLLANGVPVLQALRITEETVGNAVIARELRNARERVTDGTTISGPLAAGKVFPSTMTDLLAIGEQTGDMPGALAHIARRYENELDRNIRLFTVALEPILIILVALGVGFVAISILMAVFEVTSGLGAQ